MLSNYNNMERGKELLVKTSIVFNILESINSHISTKFINFDPIDKKDAINLIDLSQKFMLTFEYTTYRKIIFCGIIIWSDSFNDERKINDKIISLESFILNEILTILCLIRKINIC